MEIRETRNRPMAVITAPKPRRASGVLAGARTMRSQITGSFEVAGSFQVIGNFRGHGKPGRGKPRHGKHGRISVSGGHSHASGRLNLRCDLGSAQVSFEDLLTSTERDDASAFHDGDLVRGSESAHSMSNDDHGDIGELHLLDPHPAALARLCSRGWRLARRGRRGADCRKRPGRDRGAAGIHARRALSPPGIAVSYPSGNCMIVSWMPTSLAASTTFRRSTSASLAMTSLMVSPHQVDILREIAEMATASSLAEQRNVRCPSSSTRP